MRLLFTLARVTVYAASVLFATSANAVLITFDTDAAGNALAAPGVFASTVALTTLYAPLGVTFSGGLDPGDGGAILNQSGNFGVNARSGTNFLAFDRTATLNGGGIPRDPETITFATPVSSVSIFVAGGFQTGTFEIEAFDALNNLVDADRAEGDARLLEWTIELPDEASVAESLRNSGYRTAAFTGGGYVSAGSHLEQGFEIFAEYEEAKEGGPRAVAAGGSRLGAGAGRRALLPVPPHLRAPRPVHARRFRRPARPRTLPEGTSEWPRPVDAATDSEKRYMCDLYDGDILEADRAFGGFLETLKEEGRLDHAVVVVTSDHGEDLWDHDALTIPRHGHSLYEEMLHVPLFVWAPSLVRPRGRIATPVSLLDIVPTVLDSPRSRRTPRRAACP